MEYSDLRLSNLAMARQISGQKVYRALDLLTGLYDPEVRAALDRYGFSDAELERGWQLLRAFAEARRAAPPGALSENELLGELDAWENKWFVVSDAALRYSFPESHEWLFNKLSRAQGMQVIMSVTTFVGRVQRLPSTRQLGQEGKLARERLRERGVTDELLAEAEALLEKAKNPRWDVSSHDPEAEQRAEAALWNWYLEWSGIARAVLHDKRLLRHLGFGKVGRPRKKRTE